MADSFHRRVPPEHAGGPVRDAPALAELFRPTHVAAIELRGVGDPACLLAEELQCVPHARLKRLQEFAAGRVCARRALAQFGVEDFPLIMTADRLPAWPAGMVGNITHTDGYCSAVVASSQSLRSIGIDTELIDRVSARLWPRICTARELARVGTLAPSSAQRAAALLFAAKEAWYKCQYPLSRRLMSFSEVAIEWEDLEAGSGPFTVQLEHVSATDRLLTLAPHGRFRFAGSYVTAGVACPV